MDYLVAVMLLVGCGPNNSACVQIPVPMPIHDSIAECRDELAMQMRFAPGGDDRVYGACEAVPAALLDRPATIDWALSRGGDLLMRISADTAPPIVTDPAVETASSISTSPS